MTETDRESPELKPTYEELAEALKAVTDNYECEYCGKFFGTETKCAYHIVWRHIRDQG